MPKELNKDCEIEKGLYGLEITTTQKCNFNCSYCVPEGSNIFMSDFYTKKIEDIRIGDEILGFDEFTPIKKQRKINPSIVEKTFERTANVIEFTLENGFVLQITENHKILTHRGSWKKAKDFKINQKISTFPYIPKSLYEKNTNYKNGYLIGMILGDGLLKKYIDNNGYDAYRFRLAMKDSEAIDRTKKYLKEFNIDFTTRDFEISKKYKLKKEAIFSSKRESFDKIKKIIDRDFCKNFSNMYYRGFLAGIYDAEGSINKKGVIRIFNYDKDILHEIKMALKDLDFNYTEEKSGIRLYSPRYSMEKLRFIQQIQPSIKRKGFVNLYNTQQFVSKKIICIKNIGKKKVYNIQTSSRTYIANNFNVHNCFEREFVPDDNKLLNLRVHLVNQIKQLIESEWFKDTYSGIKLIFWGGEPTMNMKLCRYLLEAFEDDPRVCFFIYTNGTTIEELLPLLKRVSQKPFIKNDPKKLTIQLSYDGHPIHDMYRKSKDTKVKITSPIVQNALRLLHNNDIEFGLKSTMPWDAYCYLTMAWHDIYSLYRLYGDDRIKYSLTVDYYNVSFDKDLVEDELIRLARLEYEFYQKEGRFLSNVFRSNRAFCATGKNMATIDTNGDIYYCHGCIYSKDSKKLVYANIFEKDFINNIQNAHNYFKSDGDIYEEPEECRNCISTMCLRCNVRKFEESKKASFRDKWFDYTAQEKLCEYYKLVGKIGAALRLLIKGE